jgi:hypothetical protein
MSALQRSKLVADVTTAFDTKMRCATHGAMLTRASLVGDVLTCEVCCQHVIPVEDCERLAGARRSGHCGHYSAHASGALQDSHGTSHRPPLSGKLPPAPTQAVRGAAAWQHFIGFPVPSKPHPPERANTAPGSHSSWCFTAGVAGTQYGALPLPSANAPEPLHSMPVGQGMFVRQKM